jgi:hypothetical protein
MRLPIHLWVWYPKFGTIYPRNTNCTQGMGPSMRALIVIVVRSVNAFWTRGMGPCTTFAEMHTQLSPLPRPCPGPRRGLYPGHSRVMYAGHWQALYAGLRRGIYPRHSRGLYAEHWQGLYAGLRRGIYPGHSRGLYTGLRRGINAGHSRGMYAGH